MISSDVVASSSGDRHRQLHLDQAHDKVLRRAFDAIHAVEPSMAASFLRVDGDSVTIVAEAAVASSRLIADFILREVLVALEDENRSRAAGYRLRLRMAVAAGEVVLDPPHVAGDAVVLAARLRDSQALRDAMSAAPQRNLGLIVSDRVYQDVVSHGERGLGAKRFDPVPVSVKPFRGQGWIHVPEGEPAPPPAPAPADPPEPGNTTVHNTFHAEVHANHAVFGVVQSGRH
ncbi:hypothetical protein [Lentzea sp. NBRC 105346]|uniref:hypothetical protein n=1 Tax=Lentzea sp. NBRC 105346 TaxID=3032205 RepID=UPI0025578870|nr:hypothetical protein [Lentzea sp. NBRC 105346]